MKYPKTIGPAIDMLYKQKKKVAAANKAVEVEKAVFKEIEAHVTDLLRKGKTTMGAGQLAKVNIISKEIPVVEDWNSLYSYIKKNNSFDLLQKRLSTTAVIERWEDKKKIPGVGTFEVDSVSLTVNNASKKVKSR